MMTEDSAAEAVGGESLGRTGIETKLLNLLALVVVKGRQQSEQIELLSRAGFRPGEIAGLVGTTPHAVSVRLSEQKRNRKGKGVRKAK
jgi:hypothetical protein